MASAIVALAAGCRATGAPVSEDVVAATPASDVSSDSGSPAPSERPRPTRAELEAERALDRADVEAARGRPAEAERLYRTALDSWPDDPRVLAGLTRVLIDQGELEEAVVLDARVARVGEVPIRVLAPLERCALWLVAARARLEAGGGDVLELLDRIDAEPSCPSAGAARIRAEVFDRRARAASEAGDLEAAIEGWRIAVAADPHRPDLATRLGRALLDAGRRREAIAELSDALARHPDSPELESLMLEGLGLPVVKTHAP